MLPSAPAVYVTLSSSLVSFRMSPGLTAPRAAFACSLFLRCHRPSQGPSPRRKCPSPPPASAPVLETLGPVPHVFPTRAHFHPDTTCPLTLRRDGLPPLVRVGVRPPCRSHGMSARHELPAGVLPRPPGAVLRAVSRWPVVLQRCLPPPRPPWQQLSASVWDPATQDENVPSCVCLQPPCFPMLVPPRRTAFSLPCRLRPVRPPGLRFRGPSVSDSRKALCSVLHFHPRNRFFGWFFSPKISVPRENCRLVLCFLDHANRGSRPISPATVTCGSLFSLLVLFVVFSFFEHRHYKKCWRFWAVTFSGGLPSPLCLERPRPLWSYAKLGLGLRLRFAHPAGCRHSTAGGVCPQRPWARPSPCPVVLRPDTGLSPAPLLSGLQPRQPLDSGCSRLTCLPA